MHISALAAFDYAALPVANMPTIPSWIKRTKFIQASFLHILTVDSFNSGVLTESGNLYSAQFNFL